MEKVKSLYRLETIGLNVPDILHFQGYPPTAADDARLFHLLDTLDKDPNARVSVRTEKEGEFKSPFRPNITASEARDFISSLGGQGYEVLICKGLPTNSTVRGNCVPTAHSNYFEYLTGDGTVRDIDQSGRTPITTRLIWGVRPTGLTREVAEALQLVNTTLFNKKFDFNNEILEFSVFRKPVGIRHERVIFWEIRAWRGC